MENYKDWLKKERYKQIRFKIARTNHLFVRVKVNGIWGDFILDTGASNSCIDFEQASYFGLIASESETRASGAGANGMMTQVSYNNEIQMGRWKKNNFNFVLLDLSHVNTALTEYKTKNVHGIVGSDVFGLGQAILDYGQQTLYLK
ncbi:MULTISPECIES: retropepsin-like aspartic protease [unclassified Myroides]|uniref:retropepsin-like aspartic protease n=1 Tax=unclassified Myroides TaxID=2642485 RepID=UPI003D2F7ABE